MLLKADCLYQLIERVDNARQDFLYDDEANMVPDLKCKMAIANGAHDKLFRQKPADR